MSVDRCVCLSISFEDLKRLAERDRLSFDQLRARTRCCTGCGLCEPYVRLMLKTGRTAFEVMSPREVDAIMREAGMEM